MMLEKTVERLKRAARMMAAAICVSVGMYPGHAAGQSPLNAPLWHSNAVFTVGGPVSLVATNRNGNRMSLRLECVSGAVRYFFANGTTLTNWYSVSFGKSNFFMGVTGQTNLLAAGTIGDVLNANGPVIGETFDAMNVPQGSVFAVGVGGTNSTLRVREGLRISPY